MPMVSPPYGPMVSLLLPLLSPLLPMLSPLLPIVSLLHDIW